MGTFEVADGREVFPIMISGKLGCVQRSMFGSKNGSLRMHSRDVDRSLWDGCIRVRMFDLLLICADFVSLHPTFFSAVNRGRGIFEGGARSGSDL